MKKNYTLIELLVVTFILLIALSIGIVIIVAGIFSYKAYKNVDENGAQQTIERVWEGPPKEAEGPPKEAEGPEKQSEQPEENPQEPLDNPE